MVTEILELWYEKWRYVMAQQCPLRKVLPLLGIPDI